MIVADDKITFDRLSVEDLRDEFHEVLARVVTKANKVIESAETEVNDVLDKLAESEETCEELEKENRQYADDLDRIKSAKQVQIDFEAVERLINFAPGDPGHLYPLHERVAAVLKKVNAEFEALKAAIVPELERLEGHEKRLLAIVNDYHGRAKDKHLIKLLEEAKNAFVQSGT